jgi:hypothetical protein
MYTETKYLTQDPAELKKLALQLAGQHEPGPTNADAVVKRAKEYLAFLQSNAMDERAKKSD